MIDKLKTDWLTDGLIDFEYKKYVLLAYLQNVKRCFDEFALYPAFDELIFHYKNLLITRDNKNLFYESFPKEISKADFQLLKLNYRKIVEDDEIMNILDDIVNYAIPKMKNSLEEGKEVYELIEKNIELAPVGITPIYKDEGYLFIAESGAKDLKIYRYGVSFFHHANEKYRAIQTTYVENTYKGFQSYENLKLDIIRKYKEMPNPATYIVNVSIPCSFEQTLMPITKRMLVKHLMVA
jgi:hypothetical protein